MANRSVEMYELHIPLAAVKQLPEGLRYSYYVIGHIFNEIVSLRKLVGFCIPKHEDKRPGRSAPEQGQLMFFARITASKMWEAILTLRKKEIQEALRTDIFPKMENGSARFHELNKAFNSASWLKPIRDGIGFHYPTFEKWKKHTTPDAEWVDDIIFLGKQSGNTFYASSDALAQTWMFSQYGASTVQDAVVPLINQLIELLTEIIKFLEDVLNIFVRDILLQKRSKPKFVGKVIAPEHEQLSVPFWTFMKDALPT